MRTNSEVAVIKIKSILTYCVQPPVKLMGHEINAI